MSAAAMPRPQEHTWLWLAKIGTGVLVFVVLAIHLMVNHFVAQGGLLTYADVLAYYANPIIPLMEGLFLVFVVTHALLGVRGILLDLSPSARAVRLMDGLLATIGLAAIAYGLWLLITIAARAG